MEQEEEEEGEILFQQLVFYHISSHEVKMPLMSDVLISGLEEADQYHSPHKNETSSHWIFFCAGL
jgi:hypothetical protein